MTDTEAQTRPLRIQRRRTKGWRLPPNTVCVTRPGHWGNPFTIADSGDAQRAVDRFRQSREELPGEKVTIRRSLRGKNLACYCKLCAAHKDGKPLGLACPDCEPCHSDVLGEIANA